MQPSYNPKYMPSNLHKLLITKILLLSVLNANAQIGGSSAFNFLEMSPSARVAAQGGQNVSLVDADANLFLSNPATLNAEMHQHLGLNYANYYAGINSTTLSYAHKLDKLNGIIGTGFQYVNYGKMDGYDAGGNATQSVSAADYAFTVGYANTQGPFTFGSALKLAGSRLDTYKSSALLLDLGAVFNHPTRDFNVGLSVRNAGFVMSRYDANSPTPRLPLNVQLGASYKLEHMPLRFSLTAHNLQKLDVVYLDPANTKQLDENGNPIAKKKTIGDKIARHFIVGGEFILTQGFNLRFGYNHLARREMKLENKRGSAGFSWGFMLKVKSLTFSYSRASYSANGGTGYISVVADMNRWFKKKAAAPENPAAL